MGPHNQGKTALICQALRDSLETTKGAIYVEVPKAGTRATLARAIGRSMQYNPAAWYRGRYVAQRLVNSIIGCTVKQDDLAPFKEKLIELAKWFREKHNRPMLLVIDNADRLAKHDLDALQMLYNLSSSDVVRVVLVASNCEILTKHLRRRLFVDVVDMQDISIDEATKILRGTLPKGVSDALIKKVARELTGGRIGHVIRAARTMEDVLAKDSGVSEEKLFEAVETKLESELLVEADPRFSTNEAYKLAKALLDKHTQLSHEQAPDISNDIRVSRYEAAKLLGSYGPVSELCDGSVFWCRGEDSWSYKQEVSFQSAIAARVMRKKLAISTLSLDDVVKQQAELAAQREVKSSQQ